MRRTNEEFMAEVFARSDKIIKKRKKAKKIAAYCVPLVLCSFIGIAALSMNGGVKGENAMIDGSSGERFDVDNNYSIFEECDTAAPEVNNELGGIKENEYSGSTAKGPIAVSVESAEKETVSYKRDALVAGELEELINKVVNAAVPCEKTVAGQYNISIHFGDNTVKSYGIAGNALICEDGIYLIDTALYDSILQMIDDIIS